MKIRIDAHLKPGNGGFAAYFDTDQLEGAEDKEAFLTKAFTDLMSMGNPIHQVSVSLDDQRISMTADEFTKASIQYQSFGGLFLALIRDLQDLTANIEAEAEVPQG